MVTSTRQAQGKGEGQEGKKEEKGQNLAAEEARNKAAEAEQAKQKAVLAAKEDKQKAKEANEAKLRANLSVEEVKRKEKEAGNARARAEFAANEASLRGGEAEQKQKEAEEARLRAAIAVEEAKKKEAEAGSAKLNAEFAADEARQKEKEAEEAKIRANLAAEETRRREKQEAKEARQVKESEKADTISQKVVPALNVIPPDSKDFVSGSIKLALSPGTRGSKIMRLTNSLSNYSEIQIVSEGYIAGKGSWVGLSIKKPLPLYQILYNLAVVQQVAVTGNELQITLHNDE
jgi:hypothetical protein